PAPQLNADDHVGRSQRQFTGELHTVAPPVQRPPRRRQGDEGRPAHPAERQSREHVLGHANDLELKARTPGGSRGEGRPCNSIPAEEAQREARGQWIGGGYGQRYDRAGGSPVLHGRPLVPPGDLLRRALEGETAGVQEQRPRAEPPERGYVVRDEEHGPPLVPYGT